MLQLEKKIVFEKLKQLREQYQVQSNESQESSLASLIVTGKLDDQLRFTLNSQRSETLQSYRI